MGLSKHLDRLRCYKNQHGRELAPILKKYRKELSKCKTTDEFFSLLTQMDQERASNPALNAALSTFDEPIEDISRAMKEAGVDFLKTKSATGNIYISSKKEILPVKSINSPTIDMIESNKKIVTLDRKVSQKYLNKRSLVKMGRKVKGSLYDRVCVVCGREYVAERATSKTCSGKCRVELHRRLKKED